MRREKRGVGQTGEETEEGRGEEGGEGGEGRESTIQYCCVLSIEWFRLDERCCSPHGGYRWPHCVLYYAEASHSLPAAHRHTLD